MTPESNKLSPTGSDRRAFVLRKLHSLTGVVPVGLFLVAHLWTNAQALRGQRAFDDAVTQSVSSPHLLVLEVLGIYLPLAYHALYGLKIAMEARPNVGRYPQGKSWTYTLQRLTGLLTLGFIGYHLWQFRIQVWLGHMRPQDFFPELCASLSSTSALGIPVVAVVYLVGVAAASYHLSTGLYGFCFSWGITVSRRATRVASTAFGLFGIALFVLGANTVLYFATGSKILLSANSVSTETSLSCSDLPSTVADARHAGGQPR